MFHAVKWMVDFLSLLVECLETMVSVHYKHTCVECSETMVSVRYIDTLFFMIRVIDV